MTDNNVQFNLSTIFNKVLKSWKFIAGFTVIALVIGLIVFFIMGSTYESKTTFLLRNPMESDRNQTFSGTDFFQNKRFFADEDDIDKIIAISKSSGMLHAIISEFKLDETFGEKAEKHLKDNLKVKRNTTSEIDIVYVNKDNVLSAKVSNYAREYIKSRYEAYFKESNTQIAQNIKVQIHEIDNRVLALNDSIKQVRIQYNLNDQLLPTRGMTTVAGRTGGSMDQANGMEILATFTALKDKLSEEKSNMESLIYQYESGIKEGAGLATFFVIEEAHQDTVNALPNPKIVFPAIALLALLISTLVVIIKATFSKPAA